MAFDAKLYDGWTEGPFGVPMPSTMASEVDKIVKGLPKSDEFKYQKTWKVAKLSNEIADGERADISIISTDAIDRDKEVVIPSGIDLSQFKANPVVTFAHRYDMLPVGSAKSPGWVKYDKSLNALKAKTFYAERPEDWQGSWLPDAVFAMVKAGTLSGKSIGFVPLEVTSPKPEDIKKRPDLADCWRIYKKVLLIEYAVAPVQSNPEALVEMAAKGTISQEVLDTLGLELPEIEPEETADTSSTIEYVTISAEELAALKADIKVSQEQAEATRKMIDELRAEVLIQKEREPEIPKPKLVKLADPEKERDQRVAAEVAKLIPSITKEVNDEAERFALGKV